MDRNVEATESRANSTLHNGSIELPPLPYPEDALEPVISREIMKFHYEKHHAGYVEKTNKLLQQSNLRGKSLEEIIQQASGPLFNNAAQVWNHTFFWNCMKPGGSTLNAGELMDSIKNGFGSFDEFKTTFSKAGEDLFGSGWVWLVKDPGGNLKVESRSNADTPVKDEVPALLTLDVWEHAYYLDYKNERKKFIAKFWSIVNWDFVKENFEKAETKH
jgi:Fe-Mn family superoxide dismutase